MTFFFEETSFDRVVTLARWFITPSYPGAVLVPSSEGPRVTSAWVQTLVDHISHLKLQLKDKPGQPRRVGDVFIKCSFAKCESVKTAFANVQKVYKKDCCPFLMDISHVPTNPDEDGQGFVFLLHNHHTIEPIAKTDPTPAIAPADASGASQTSAEKSKEGAKDEAESAAKQEEAKSQPAKEAS
eukprot:scpid84696/ scgid34866/ 